MLIEIHVIQNHAPSNLNRDDTGSPKECFFGGVRRGRVSSQCLKRSIRRSDLFQHELEGHLATRTRQLPEEIRKCFAKDPALAEYAALAAKKVSGFGTKAGTEQPLKDGKYRTAQTMFLTDDDITAVMDVLKKAVSDTKTVEAFEKLTSKDLQGQACQVGFRPIAVDVALFGRMITSDAFRDVEASAQVAHALSTHSVKHEFDYFTAVDDLAGTGEESDDGPGGDMLGDVEFNSACYYKYFSIDAAGLIDNLTGKKLRDVSAADQTAAVDLAALTLDVLLRAAVLVTPSGKQNTFAAHQLPAAVLIEVRPYCTPVSYANAFVKPAAVGTKGLVQASWDIFAPHVEALTSGFNLNTTHRWLLAPEHSEWAIKGVERVTDLTNLCDRLKEAVKNGEANSASTS